VSLCDLCLCIVSEGTFSPFLAGALQWNVCLELQACFPSKPTILLDSFLSLKVHLVPGFLRTCVLYPRILETWNFLLRHHDFICVLACDRISIVYCQCLFFLCPSILERRIQDLILCLLEPSQPLTDCVLWVMMMIPFRKFWPQVILLLSTPMFKVTERLFHVRIVSGMSSGS
jgi:hypothetical protein